VGRYVDRGIVPQNAIDRELCLRLTNGKPALAHWIGDGETRIGKNVKGSLHCSAPEQSTISSMLAPRNGGLPKR
jgi:hypothetical protein